MKQTLCFISTCFVPIIFGLFGCKSIERTTPENPSPISLNLDLSDFIYNPDSTSYYNDASNKLFLWEKLIGDSMNFQRTFYNEGISNRLQFQNNDTWLSKKNLVIDGNTFLIDLFEIVVSDTLYTKMFLTKDSIYSEVLLLDGISYTDQSGSWLVNQNDTADTYMKLLTIDYKISNNSLESIKFTFNQQGNFNGNTLYYKDSTDGIYNSYIELVDKISENITIIEWNNSTHEGMIKDVNLYGDTIWRCWDENVLNSICN
jgi:hypothetical protein